MGFDIKDLAGISEPAKKLIEVVSAGIGAVFRPRGIRSDADAKAYEIRALASAQADAGVIKAAGESKAELERIKQLVEADPHLYERAKQRLLCREIEGQANIEAIAEKALLSLPSSVSEQPVADDWRRKFFLEAENICDQDLQLLWAKVLSGEVSSPGSYSLRTLETLKHLSKADAELFRLVCNLAVSDGWIIKPSHDVNTCLEPYNLNYSALMSLRDAGLLHEGDTLLKRFTFSGNATPVLVLQNNGVLIEFGGPSLPNTNFQVLTFTRAGQELQNLIENNPCMPYLHAIATSFRAQGFTVRKGTQTKKEGGVTVLSFDEDI